MNLFAHLSNLRNDPVRLSTGLTVCLSVVMPIGIAMVMVMAMAMPALAGHRHGHGPMAPESLRSADEVFLAAHDAAERGDRARLARIVERHAASHRLHRLAIYLDFWPLRERLQAASESASADDATLDRDATAFIAAHPDTYVADRIRLDWTMLLGARAASAATPADAAAGWAAFERERARIVWSDEPPLRCLTALSAYVRNEGRRIDELARDARALLASSRETASDGCARLADVLTDDNRLSVWERARALVENNQLSGARRVLARVPGDDGVQAAAALDRPAVWLGTLTARSARTTAVEREIALIALARLARDTPEAAARHALTLEASFTPEQRGLVWGRIGHMAAVKHAPEALEWYQRGGTWVGSAPSATRVDEVLEWQVRAALRGVAGATGPHWPTVRAAVERMPADLQSDPSWVYWHARALLASGGAAETAVARERLRALLSHPAHAFSYYGLLAAETLGEAVRLPPRSLPPAADAVAQFQGNAGLERAFSFYELGLRADGHREWNWQIRRPNNFRGLDDRGLLALAEYARTRGVLDRVIATSERTRSEFDFEQRYPAPHRDALLTHTAAAGLAPTWVYGLIRQESRFIADARSSAGAMGLMQLMPATARYVARRAGFDDFSPTRVTDTDLNLRLGTQYLRYVLDDLDGSPLMASAAYNAGPRRARAWRASLPRGVEGAIYAETIPFNETRDYVKRVLANAAIYGALLSDGRVPPLAPRLGTIQPRPAGATEVP